MLGARFQSFKETSLKDSTSLKILENLETLLQLGPGDIVVYGFGHREAAYTNSPFLKPVGFILLLSFHCL